MLFSEFIKRGGLPVFDASSQEYEYSDGISIDTDSGNVHILTPDADDILVTLSNPTITTPDNQIIINNTGFSVSVVSGSLFVLPANSVFFFTWDGSGWVRYVADLLGLDSIGGPPIGSVEYKLIASDSQDNDHFGTSISMNSDGTRIIIGATGEDTGGSLAGAAYIFSWDGSTWSEDQKIQGSDTDTSDVFGTSVSMSANGNKVAVGARSATGSRGAVYVFSWNGSSWVEDQKVYPATQIVGDFFGSSVSMNADGTKMVVGADGEDGEVLFGVGAAYIFSWNGSSWVEDQRLFDSDSKHSDYFGSASSMSADGSRVIVGAYGRDLSGTSAAGSAYIYNYNGSSWVLDQEIYSDNLADSGWFGGSVSMNSDGSRVIIGSYQDDRAVSLGGAAYSFSRSGSVWSLDEAIIASDIDTQWQFGKSVSVSGDGVKMVVGASNDDTNGSLSGSVYVFSWNGSTWVEDQKLVPSDISASDYVGNNGLCISSDGSRVAVAATGEDTGGSSAGAVYIF